MKRQDPLRIQTPLAKPNCFEGYYFKHMDEASQQSVAFIVGFSSAQDNPHCFIQLIRSTPLETHYFAFPLDAFSIQYDPFELRIANNTFGEQGVHLQLQQEGLKVEAQLSYGALTPLQASPIMGPFAMLPKMECNHGIVSMYHEVKGSLRWNEQEILFTQGLGYIEKDWGHSFPSAYVWVHAAWSKPKQSLFFSMATIPYLGIKFSGVICNVVVEDKEYRFATYTMVKVKVVALTSNEVRITLKQGKLTLHLHAHCDDAGALKAPHSGQMSHIIKEGLKGSLTYALYQGKTLLAQNTTTLASMELVNPTALR